MKAERAKKLLGNLIDVLGDEYDTDAVEEMLTWAGFTEAEIEAVLFGDIDEDVG